MEKEEEIPVKKVSAQKWRDRALGCFWGMGVGDALGAPFEFQTVKKINLQKDLAIPIAMQGGGRFLLKAGQWTDDTSQGLCLVEAFVANAKQWKSGFEPKLFMDLVCNWLNSAHNAGRGGKGAVGLGMVIKAAVDEWGKKTDDPIESAFLANFPKGARDASKRCDGNGSTMRCAAPAVFADSLEEAMLFAYQQSLVTTPGLQSAACAAFMAYLSYQALHADPTKDPNALKEALLSEDSLNNFLPLLLKLNSHFDPKYQICEGSQDYWLIQSLCLSRNAGDVSVLIMEEMDDKDYPGTIQIVTQRWPNYTQMYQEVQKNGSYTTQEDGTTVQYRFQDNQKTYVNWRVTHNDYELNGPEATSDPTYYGSYVISGMALALHILHNTHSFNEAVQMAALMCGDADSNAAIVGILAGSIYGGSTICPAWLEAINQYPLNVGSPVTIQPFMEEAVDLKLRDLKKKSVFSEDGSKGHDAKTTTTTVFSSSTSSLFPAARTPRITNDQPFFETHAELLRWAGELSKTHQLMDKPTHNAPAASQNIIQTMITNYSNASFKSNDRINQFAKFQTEFNDAYSNPNTLDYIAVFRLIKKHRDEAIQNDAEINKTAWFKLNRKGHSRYLAMLTDIENNLVHLWAIDAKTQHNFAQYSTIFNERLTDARSALQQILAEENPLTGTLTQLDLNRVDSVAFCLGQLDQQLNDHALAGHIKTLVKPFRDLLKAHQLAMQPSSTMEQNLPSLK